VRCAVVALTGGGCRLAARIARVAECDIYVYRGRNNILPPGSIREFTSLAKLYSEIIPGYRVIIMIMALGIVVRTISPHLSGKDTDPAVLVMDEKGAFVISAVSGHLGGANSVAAGLAEKLGATPVITTATDVQGLAAVDTVAHDLGWAVEPLSGVRRVNGALANGEKIVLATDLDYLVGKTLAGQMMLSLHHLRPLKAEIPLVVVSSRTGRVDRKPCLYLRPGNLYLGIGCKKGTGFRDLHRAVAAVMDENHLSWKSVKELATCTVKKGEPGLEKLAGCLNLPLKLYSPRQLVDTMKKYSLSGSNFVKSEIGVEGVCEPAAMTGARLPRLVVAKRIFPGITVAVAEDTSLLSA